MRMADAPIIALAGAGGDLGGRIAKALVARGATVHALVRPGLQADEARRIEATGAKLIEADPASISAMAKACAGSTCVVSALNGVRSVMIDRQSVLLEAAVKAGVPRFIPSDYSADFTRTLPGRNRNFDLRRDFMKIADAAPIKVTSILNGAFMDMLGAEMPIIQPAIHRVLYWHDADQPLDFTTKDDTAAFVAAAAMDDATPRILRIAGDVVSARDLARIMTDVHGERYRPLWAGGIALLGGMIAVTKLIVPGADEAFPPWQGMQYMRDQFSGRAKLSPLDNARYSDLEWTTAVEMMRARVLDGVNAVPRRQRLFSGEPR
jgi:nucleoside-diphosphate-sugar epimerase